MFLSVVELNQLNDYNFFSVPLTRSDINLICKTAVKRHYKITTVLCFPLLFFLNSFSFWHTGGNRVATIGDWMRSEVLPQRNMTWAVFEMSFEMTEFKFSSHFRQNPQTHPTRRVATFFESFISTLIACSFSRSIDQMSESYCWNQEYTKWTSQAHHGLTYVRVKLCLGTVSSTDVFWLNIQEKCCALKAIPERKSKAV